MITQGHHNLVTVAPSADYLRLLRSGWFARIECRSAIMWRRCQMAGEGQPLNAPSATRAWVLSGQAVLRRAASRSVSRMSGSAIGYIIRIGKDNVAQFEIDLLRIRNISNLLQGLLTRRLNN
jgi:hypothetical protein